MNPAAAARARTVLCAVAVQFAGCGIAGAADPVLRTQFMVRDGYVAVDPAATRLEFGTQAAAFEACGLTEGGVRDELIRHLDGLMKQRGKVLDQLAAPPFADPGDAEAVRRRAAVETALRELARTDAATSALYRLDASWLDAEAPVTAWMQAHADSRPAVTLGRRALKDAYEPFFQEPRLADGPLLPASDLFSVEDPAIARRGVAVFRLAPPLGRVAATLRPESNTGEWDAHRGDLAQDLLAPFACKLWYRDRIVERAQDYFEMRGVTLQAFRSPRDARDAQGLVQPRPAPTDTAGIAPERPSFARQDFGGRVILAPDPLLENVYIELDASREWDTLQRVLYLLLPTRDWRQVHAAPGSHLCRMPAVWKPDGAAGRPEVVRLALASNPGAALELARSYLTRGAFGERLRRLDTLGFVARMDFPSTDAAKRRKSVSLLVERGDKAPPPASGEPGPAIPVCSDAAPAARAEAVPAPVSGDEHPDIVRPRPVDPGRRAGQTQRHHLVFGVEHDAGKPLRYSAAFSRTGLTDDDTVSIEVGQQSRSSGNVQYSRDFLGFATFERRMQLTARAFSDFDPERTPLAAGTDERRTGAEIRATIDLWRDRGGSFGQLELGAGGREIEITGTAAASPASRTRVTQLDLGLTVAAASDGTPASARFEGGASVARGRASDAPDAYTRLDVDFARHRFLGAFTRWDLRAHLRHLEGEAPLSEWPVFGGEESVRGYPADAAVARSTWVIQNEYWMPLSALAGDAGAWSRTLRRSAAFAVLADVGGLHRSASPLAGRKLGLGAGLRLTLNDALVLRLDWAHAVGADAGSAGRSGRLYLSVSSRRAL